MEKCDSFLLNAGHSQFSTLALIPVRATDRPGSAAGSGFMQLYFSSIAVQCPTANHVPGLYRLTRCIVPSIYEFGRLTNQQV